LVILSPLVNCLCNDYIPKLIYCQPSDCAVQTKQTDNNGNYVHHNLSIVAYTQRPSHEQYGSKSECYNIIGIHVSHRIQDVTCYDKHNPCPLNDVICFIHK